MKKFLTYTITAIIFLGIGILIADTKVADVARTAAKSAKTATIEVVANAAFFETDEGIVLVDTGMGPSGPAIMDAIRSVSDKPIHTIIYTHGHVDHAYGAPSQNI